MSFKPPRDSRLTNSAEVLQALFENGKSPLSGPFLRWKIWKKWPELVGPTVAAASEPVAFRDGTLAIWVKSAAWMQQLVFAREQIRVTLNQKLGADMVKTVQLTLDRRSVPADPEEKRKIEEVIKTLMKEG